MAGRTVLVTGGASGIGLAVCKRLADASAIVALTDLRGDEAAKAAKEIKGAFPVTLDITNVSSCAAAVAEVVKRHGKLDVVVNNAGIGHVGACHATAPEDLEKLWKVNVAGAFTMTKAALEAMRAAKRGVFVNICSIASHIPLVERCAYAMTKAALLALTKSVAIDYVKDGIRANSVSPARVHTPFVDAYLAKNYTSESERAAKFKELSSYQPVGRMGTPEDVAAIVHVLASDASAFTTGCDYPVDGGTLFCR